MILRPVGDGCCRVELTDEHGTPLPSYVGGALHAGTPKSPTLGGVSEHQHHMHGSSGHRSLPHLHQARNAGSASGAAAAAAAAATFFDFEMTLQEQGRGSGGGGDGVLLLTAASRADGRPVLVETITLQSDMRVSLTLH